MEATRQPAESRLASLPVLQEYESIIKSLQEQLHTLKSRLAAAEDVCKRQSGPSNSELHRALRKYEAEAQELGCAVRTYEKEQSRLLEDAQFWEGKAKSLESKLAQSLEEAEDWDAKYTSVQSALKLKSDQLLQSEAALQASQSLASQLSAEVRKLKDQLQSHDSQIPALKSTLHSLESQSELQEDQLRAASKKVQTLSRRVEALEKENGRLESTVQTLEMDRKKLLMKWQRTKTEERLKGRVKEMEELCARLEATIKRQDSEQAESRTKLADKEFALTAALSQIQRLTVQLKVMESEKEVVAQLNKDLSVRLSRAEEKETREWRPRRKEEDSSGEMSDTRRLQEGSDPSSPDLYRNLPLQLHPPRSSSSFSPAPLPEEHKGRSKTPSQCNTSRGSPNPPSLGSGQKAKNDAYYPDLELSAVASTGQLRLSRRTPSERQQWKS